jgi:serine/threonine-protein kinase
MTTTDRVGDVLVDTYRLVRLVAEGGMGAVYEAQHVRVPKRFAIKLLRVELLNKTEAMARFRREAEIIAAIDHPNIVNLVDYNLTQDGIPFIVLEFLDGEDLHTRLGRGAYSLEEAMPVVVQVARALSAAHARDVVHRDLKPENILLCRGQTVKVVDFGVAKLRGGADLTAVNSTVGTVPYMSPEQITGQGGLIDARTDQYALAVILYEMLSGGAAFGDSEDLVEIAKEVLNSTPPPVEGVAPAVNEVIARAMAKRRDSRFPSVDAFLEALTAAAAQSAPDPPASETPVNGTETDGPVLDDLPGIPTEVTPPPRQLTPTAEVDRAAIAPPPPRVTAKRRRLPPSEPGWRAVAAQLRERPTTMSIAVGALVGLVVAALWLLAK